MRARWGAPREKKKATLGQYRGYSLFGNDANEERKEKVGGNEVELITPQAPALCAGFEGSVVLGVAKDPSQFVGSVSDKNAAADKVGGRGVSVQLLASS